MLTDTPDRNKLVNLAIQNDICVDLDLGIDDDYTTDYVKLANAINESKAEVIFLT